MYREGGLLITGDKFVYILKVIFNSRKGRTPRHLTQVMGIRTFGFKVDSFNFKLSDPLLCRELQTVPYVVFCHLKKRSVKYMYLFILVLIEVWHDIKLPSFYSAESIGSLDWNSSVLAY